MFFRKMILKRRKGESLYETRKMLEACSHFHPDDEYLRQEMDYWKRVYWLTGEVTRVLGIDAASSKRMISWNQETYDCKKISLQDIILHVDHPALLPLIAMEFADILPQGMYSHDSKTGFLSPVFSSSYLAGDGPYETESVQLHPNDIVIDCGAKMGIFSVLAVKRGAKTVYAFDPQERALRLLDANIKSNGCEGKIIPVPFGLSDKKCSISFTEENGNMDSSHISRESDTTTIECTTLDDWVTGEQHPENRLHQSRY